MQDHISRKKSKGTVNTVHIKWYKSKSNIKIVITKYLINYLVKEK